MLFKVVGGSLILIVAGAIAARVAVAVLPEGRWRTRLIVGATFLGWFLWGALRKSSVNHWDQGLADQIAIVMSSAIIAAFWTVPAWLVCRRYDRRAATLPPALDT
jgi:Flp pilus assembly protein TadB